MAEKETAESQQEFSDVVSVCDDFEVIEPDIGSDPVRRSFHDDLESEKTPTASPTQSVFLNTMSIEGSEKSFVISKSTPNEPTDARPTTPTPSDIGNLADPETPIMSESMSDFSMPTSKTVLDELRNLGKMFESHMIGSTMTVTGGEVAMLKEENEELKVQLSTEKKINKRLMETVDEKTEEIHRIRKAVTKQLTEESEGKMEEMLMKLEAALRQNAILQEKQENLKVELQASTIEKMQLMEQNESLKKDGVIQKHLEDMITALKLDIDHLHAKLAEKEEMIAAMSRAEQFSGRVGSSGIDEEALVTCLRNKTDYIQALEIEIKKLREQITKIQLDAEDKAVIITVLQEENNEGTRMIAELEQKERNRRLLEEARDRNLVTGLADFTN
ncbi:unnamed protein product, partial [Mesorhabditis belari]|uniref:Uncharacterized protein n=1 Tax=Mesorhabditis belari TaxID=2138241 RepID=A0AAF3FH15_9BILA